MNRTMLIGNLTRDPEPGTTPSGINYCAFTVAARRRYHREGEPDSVFVRVTAWRGLGDTCAKFLKKGRKVCVLGEMEADAYLDRGGQPRAGLSMDADEVEFLSPKGQQDAEEPEETGES